MKSQCLDFLTVDPEVSPYNKVNYILCDPSCSGSGIVGRLDYLLDNSDLEHDTEVIFFFLKLMY